MSEGEGEGIGWVGLSIASSMSYKLRSVTTSMAPGEAWPWCKVPKGPRRPRGSTAHRAQGAEFSLRSVVTNPDPRSDVDCGIEGYRHRVRSAPSFG